MIATGRTIHGYRRRTVPRDSEEATEEFEALATQRRGNTDTAVIDEDEVVDSFDLPDADISGEELTVRVVPKQANEFTCSSCFLQHHNRCAAARQRDDLRRLRVSRHHLSSRRLGSRYLRPRQDR